MGLPFMLQPASAVPLRALALFDAGGAGSTVAVEFLTAGEVTTPQSDAAGVKWPHVVIALPAGKAVGLQYQLMQTVPGAAAMLGVPDAAAQVVLRVVTGSITINSTATVDGSVGGDTGNGNNGILTAGMAPSLTSPVIVFAGDFIRLGRTR